MLEKHWVSNKLNCYKALILPFHHLTWQLAQKYDPQTEEALRIWIHEVTGRTVPDDFMQGLKDGVILCE